MAGKAIGIRWTLTFAAMQADIIALMVSLDNFLREFTGYCSARFWTVPAREGKPSLDAFLRAVNLFRFLR